MKRLTLFPAQVIATGELCPEADSALKIYFHVFSHDGGDSLPPIIVGTIKSPSAWKDLLEEGYSRWARSEPAMVEIRRREYNSLFRALIATPYYILDGNNRALAAALNRKNLRVLHLDADRDLKEIELLVATGEILSFPHRAQTIEGLEGIFLRHFLDLNNIPPNHSLTASQNWVTKRLTSVATRTYDLCTQNLLPGYMIRRYSKAKIFRQPLIERV